MKLWILTNLFPDWGQTGKMLIRAESEKAARKMAGNVAYGEGRSALLDPKRFSCLEVSSEGEPAILIASTLD